MLGQTLHTSALWLPSLIASAVALSLLGVRLALAPSSGWVLVAFTAVAASVALSLSGVSAAPAFDLMALVAMGIGGAFRSVGANQDLLAEPGLAPVTALRPTEAILDRAA
jgi:hypothetical protein